MISYIGNWGWRRGRGTIAILAAKPHVWQLPETSARENATRLSPISDPYDATVALHVCVVGGGRHFCKPPRYIITHSRDDSFSQLTRPEKDGAPHITRGPTAALIFPPESPSCVLARKQHPESIHNAARI